MKKKQKGIVDPILFKTIIDKEKMTVQQQHREMLGKFIARQGMKICKGKVDITFEQVFEILNKTIEQTQKLKESYEKGN